MAGVFTNNTWFCIWLSLDISKYSKTTTWGKYQRKVDKYCLQNEEWRSELGVMSINVCPNIISHKGSKLEF